MGIWLSWLFFFFYRYLFRNFFVFIKVNLYFFLSRSGVLILDRVEVVIEIIEWVEVFKKNLIVENFIVFVNLLVEVFDFVSELVEIGLGDFVEGNSSLNVDGSISDFFNFSVKEENIV